MYLIIYISVFKVESRLQNGKLG